MGEIDPREFGALQADVKNLCAEIHMLRKEMAQVQALLNQGRGGLAVLLLGAGSLGAAITIVLKKVFGA